MLYDLHDLAIQQTRNATETTLAAVTSKNSCACLGSTQFDLLLYREPDTLVPCLGKHRDEYGISIKRRILGERQGTPSRYYARRF